MIKSLDQMAVDLRWLEEAPKENRKAALLIPQYNEGSNANFESRLSYFKGIADQWRDELDVVLIDDGSTDGSLERITEFLQCAPGAFYVASVFPNANKVGALFLTTAAVSHPFIILSDFDTDLVGIGELFANFSVLDGDASLMGGYFRMLPFEGSGHVFLYQQLEYSLARSIYRFHQKEKSVRVMPGAGSCYKRESLLAVYRQHSGLRNGEDREATLLGLKMGYKAVYMDDVLALTRPPLTLKALLKQRVRWNLGYIETLHKERRYYLEQIRKLSRIGMITLSDLLFVAFLAMLPFILLLLAVKNITWLLGFVTLYYVISIAWCFMYVSSREAVEFKPRWINSILIFPFFKVVVDYFSWMRAMVRFATRSAAAKPPAGARRSKKMEPSSL
jgi:cellulose synthase/poly-beta-1,6-N-acetylglucosamine synthase-like glycosyltransferase